MKNEPCPRCRERGKDSRGDNLVFWPDGGGHCFSCGYHKHPQYKGPLTRIKEPSVKENLLPFDFTREVPIHAWQWLLKYGLPQSYWRESVGYSEKEQRLYFLIKSSPSIVAFSIGRYVGTEAHRKWFVRGSSHSGAFQVGEGTATVIVEDWISANKVGQVTECLPLFGTTVHPAHIYALTDGSERPIVLWLDKDQEGTTNKKAARLQMLVNRPVTVVHTQLDPKLLSFKEIKNEIDF
jgi:hypothetical protein